MAVQPGAGHYPWLDNPQWLVRTLAAFLSAVIAGLLVMRVEQRPPVAHAPALEAMREGFRYVFGHRWPRAVVTIIATFAVFGFSFLTMMPVFARDALGLDARGYGAIVSAVGVGASVAALFMASGRQCCSVSSSRRPRSRRGSGQRCCSSPSPAASWRSTASARTPCSRSRRPTICAAG